MKLDCKSRATEVKAVTTVKVQEFFVDGSRGTPRTDQEIRRYPEGQVACSLVSEKGKGQSPEQSSSSTYWLITKSENSQTEVLTISLLGQEVLPVFSYEEEGTLFLRLGGFGSGWRIREIEAGELTLVLFGPCAGIGRIALDPWPGTGVETMANLLVTLSRERFINHLKVDKLWQEAAEVGVLRDERTFPLSVGGWLCPANPAQ